MKRILIVLPIIFLSLLSNSQEIVLISKEDVIAKVQENNNAIKMSLQEVLMAKGDFNQTNAVFLPNITASHTGMATTNPLMAFGSKLNQGILTQNDFLPALLNNPSQIEDYATKIEILQPLVNLDGIYQRKAAKAKLNATELQSERTKDYMFLEVEKTYMQLQLAYKTVDVLEKAKQTALENKRLADNGFKQGYLQRADVLNVEVRVLEVKNQLQNAKSSIANISNYLSALMNDTSYNILKPTDSLTVITTEKITESLPENRADILAMNFATEAYKQMHQADKVAFLPRLNAFGSYELHDDKIFQGHTNGYLFGAQLSWNILEGSKRFGKKQKSKAEFEKSKIQQQQYIAQSQIELNKANRMLQDAKNSLELSSLALLQSEESLRIRTNRFKQGLERTTDLLLAETQYSQKQLEYFATVFEHNFAVAYLQFLTRE
ncbi:MAG: TolC family protein [Bacteroidetes bacterium]|nr:TolC family protein [Bacteroidota bacterium]